MTLDEAELATASTPDERAVTVKVYADPFANPVTVIGELAPVAVIAPGELVTIYETVPLPL